MKSDSLSAGAARACIGIQEEERMEVAHKSEMGIVLLGDQKCWDDCKSESGRKEGTLRHGLFN
jgi:hypothetical protein